jgi:hypothetical protein
MTTVSSSMTVSGLLITEGEVTARAGDGHDRRRVLIRVAALEPAAWESAVTTLSADAALMASVLDGEVPAALVQALALGGQALEPSPGELRWSCSCRTRYGRCAHARAVWHEVEAELRRHPALALTLRGTDASRLAAEASALAATAASDHDPGVDAASAYARTARGLPVLPDTPGPPGAARPGFSLGPSAPAHQRLHDQASDAAARALDVLQGTGDACLALDRQSDLARLGAALPSDWDVDHLAWRAGMRPAALRGLVQAWRASGRAASRMVAAAGPLQTGQGGELPPSSPLAGEVARQVRWGEKTLPPQRREATPVLEQLSFL